MPNAKVLSEKKKIVEDLTEKLKSPGGVLVNYIGLNVNDDTAMRVKLRETNIDYQVVKNTLMRFAIKNVGFEELDPILNGTTSLAVSKDDPIAPARLIKEFADQFNGFFEIKAGFMDGKVLSAGEVIALAGIPPLPILQAQLLGTMLAPITSLAVVLKAIAEKGGTAADATAETKASAGAEAVPTEETAVEAAVEVAAETPEVAEEVAVEAAVEVTPEAPEVAEAPATESAVEVAAETPEVVEEVAVEAAVEATEEKPEAAPTPAKTAKKAPAKAAAKESAPDESTAAEPAPDEPTAAEPPAKEPGTADDPAES